MRILQQQQEQQHPMSLFFFAGRVKFLVAMLMAA
jgi:hypothetical protein